MRRIALIGLVSFLAGCTCTPDELVEPVPTGEPWDMTHLITADPTEVTDDDLIAHARDLTEHYWEFNQVRGIIWPGWRSSGSLAEPDGYGTGGDGGIFTGMALATYALEYGTTGTQEAKDRAMETLKGVWWLTHAAGKGVIARCVFPIAEGAKWGYPGGRWQKYPEFMQPGPALVAPWGETLPESFYYTRATKDQLTGILMGLSFAWLGLRDIPEARTLIATIVEDMRAHLVKHNWKIRNENGKNKTNADSVTRLLRTMFNALYRHTVTISNPAGEAEAEAEYVKNFHVRSIERAANITNNFSQYYAHNLRMCRGFSVWLLEIDPVRKAKCRDLIVKDVWEYTKRHQNAWYAAIVTAVDPSNGRAKGVLRYGLQSLSLKPLRAWGSPYGSAVNKKREPNLAEVLHGCDYKWVVPPHWRKPTNYMTWQKRPWDVGSGIDKEGRGERTGLGYLAPYWVGRAFGGL